MLWSQAFLYVPSHSPVAGHVLIWTPQAKIFKSSSTFHARIPFVRMTSKDDGEVQLQRL